MFFNKSSFAKHFNWAKNSLIGLNVSKKKQGNISKSLVHFDFKN